MKRASKTRLLSLTGREGYFDLTKPDSSSEDSSDADDAERESSAQFNAENERESSCKPELTATDTDLMTPEPDSDGCGSSKEDQPCLSGCASDSIPDTEMTSAHSFEVSPPPAQSVDAFEVSPPPAQSEDESKAFEVSPPPAQSVDESKAVAELAEHLHLPVQRAQFCVDQKEAPVALLSIPIQLFAQQRSHTRAIHV